MIQVAHLYGLAYPESVTATSVAGIGVPKQQAHHAPSERVFSCPSYGGVRRGPKGPPVPVARYANLRIPPPFRLASKAWRFSTSATGEPT